MKAALITLAFLVVVGLFGFGFWASYQEVQNPSPTAHPMTEIELDAHQMDVQLEHQKDATSKMSTVVLASYATITGITSQHTFRDVVVILGLCFLAWVWLQSKRKDGGK